jgi:hypothetical protein
LPETGTGRNVGPLDRVTDERRFDSLKTMSTLEDIEKALSELPADQLAEFRAWFETFDAPRFDERIEWDAKVGRLDRLAEQALADFRAGSAREL